jgi:PilZ domain-containing protein
MPERRAHPRYAFTGAVQAVDGKSRITLNARTSDIGKGGCYVDVFSPFPLKTPVKIRITNEHTSLLANADVIYSRLGMGMGLRFTHLEPADTPVLEKWISELSGRPPIPVPPQQTQAKEEEFREDMLRRREQWYVLNELVLSLMRKSILTHTEGKAMMEQLLRQEPKY